MVDCSRNGVLRLESVNTLLCNMALMGLSMLQLYTEDTYEVSDLSITMSNDLLTFPFLVRWKENHCLVTCEVSMVDGVASLGTC